MFVETIKLFPSELQTSVQKHLEAFMDNYSERNLKAQAQRVVGHFAFLAGVVEIGIQWKNYPGPKGTLTGRPDSALTNGLEKSMAGMRLWC